MKKDMSCFYAFWKTVATPIVMLLFPHKAYGKLNIPKTGGAVLCCNHMSVTDIAFLVVSCPRQIHFMGKKEIFKNPLIAWFLKKMGAFSVDREGGGAAAIETAKSLVNQGKIVGIFPEGTRNHTGRPGRAKSGAVVIAAQTKVSVVPASIYHKTTGLPIFQKTTVRYGEPIPPEEINIEDMSRSELRRVTELVMERITSLWEVGH